MDNVTETLIDPVIYNLTNELHILYDKMCGLKETLRLLEEGLYVLRPNVTKAQVADTTDNSIEAFIARTLSVQQDCIHVAETLLHKLNGS